MCLFTALRDSEIPLWGAGSSLRRREEGPGTSSNRIDPMPAGVEATGKSCPRCLWDLVGIEEPETNIIRAAYNSAVTALITPTAQLPGRSTLASLWRYGGRAVHSALAIAFYGVPAWIRTHQHPRVGDGLHIRVSKCRLNRRGLD